MSFPADLYFGASPAWLRVQHEIELLALSDLPLLLLGPTGSGKSVLVKYIHAISKRRGNYIKHTIKSVPDPLLYSALVGHERGAFTGATEKRMGLMELARDGTFFLDELGLVTEEIQHLLLGLIEGGTYTPIGASRPIPIDLRPVFATNEEPEQLVRSGKWRRDFYYRLGGNFVRFPSLASRKTDILPLTDLFLHRRLRNMGRPWRSGVSDQVRDVFLHHPWPGNIRELQSVCDRAAIFMQTERVVEMSDLTPEFLGELAPANRPNQPDPVVAKVHDALRRNHNNKSAAAKELGIHRSKLHRFVQRFPRLTPPGGSAQPA